MTPARSYTPFLDWMKCVGMLLILYGHLVGWAPLTALPPIYSKQLGVALFLFATGYSLSRDGRDRSFVVYNRLFEVFLYGIGVALVVSLAMYVTRGRLNPSNYLPFFGGANVVFNNFPANPSTWYLGTYIHIILLWALVVSRIRVSVRGLVLCAAAEILVRAVLMQSAGLYIAYMAFTNWITVFLMGCWYGSRRDESAPPRPGTAWLPAVAIGVAVAAWVSIVRSLPFDPRPLEGNFPFMRLPGDAISGALIVSAMVSTLYLGLTWLAFMTFRPLPAPAAVRFVARNTLFIFLVHMPLLYVMDPVVSVWTGNRPLRSLVYVTAALPCLALVSELLRKLIQPQVLRERVRPRYCSASHSP